MRQIKAFLEIRRPRSAITLAFVVIGVPCGLVGSTVCCPFSSLILGPVASFLIVTQEKGKIPSREEGAIVGLISGLIIAFSQVIVGAIFLWYQLNFRVPTAVLSDPSNWSAGDLWYLFILATSVNLFFTAGAAYLVAYMSTVPETAMKSFETPRSFPKPTNAKDMINSSERSDDIYGPETRSNGSQGRSKAISFALFVVTLIVGIVSSIASNILPPEFTPFLWLSWPLLAILVIISILLYLKQ
jgi:hypothetical protein